MLKSVLQGNMKSAFESFDVIKKQMGKQISKQIPSSVPPYKQLQDVKKIKGANRRQRKKTKIGGKIKSVQASKLRVDVYSSQEANEQEKVDKAIYRRSAKAIVKFLTTAKYLSFLGLCRLVLLHQSHFIIFLSILCFLNSSTVFQKNLEWVWTQFSANSSCMSQTEKIANTVIYVAVHMLRKIRTSVQLK